MDWEVKKINCACIFVWRMPVKSFINIGDMKVKKLFGLTWNDSYMRFRARQHQRSLTPVWMIFIIMMANGIGDGWDLSFPDICLTDEEKPRGKNLNQENRPGRGSNPGLIGERQRCYPLTTTVISLLVIFCLDFHYSIIFIYIIDKIIYFYLSIHYIYNVLTINYSAESCWGWFCKSISSTILS